MTDDKNSEIDKRWVNAAIAIVNNKNAQVLCPVCQKSILKIEVVEIVTIIEIYMMCGNCGAYNAILKRYAI